MRRRFFTVSAILLLSGILDIIGITWSLPSKSRNSFYPSSRQARLEIVTVQDGTHPHYALEPIDTRHPDEKKFMAGVSRMSLVPLDLIPDDIYYGTVTTYLIAAGMGVSSVLGLTSLHTDRVFYMDHPEQMAEMYLVGRRICSPCGGEG